MSGNRSSRNGTSSGNGHVDYVVLSAFGKEATARVTGLSERRLARWAREGWFTPSYGDPERPAAFGQLYSYADLVRLRTAAALMERGVPVRRALAAVRGRTPLEQQQVPGTALYVVDREVVRQGEAGARTGTEAVEPGPVAAEVEERVRRLGERTPEQIGATERRRGLVNGWELFAGTRIPVGTIVGLLEDGWPRSEILANYARLRDPDLDVADARLRERHVIAG